MITEFRQRPPQQQEPFVVEVEYLDESKMEETISELLISYRRFYLPDVETLESEDYKRIQDESTVAWSTLQAAFDNKMGFDEELFRDHTHEGEFKALNLLLQWSQELDWPEEERNGLWSFASHSVDDCRKVVRELMRNRIWPFTKVIRWVL